MIHILDRQTDRILTEIDETEILEANHTHGANLFEMFDFKMFVASEKSKHLQKRERVIFQDEDGSYREFVLYETDTDTETGHKYVYTQASYLELSKVSVIDPIKLVGSEVIGSTQYVLSGTEWQLGLSDYAGIRTYTIDEPTNPYAALKAIASLHGLKIRFRIVVKGNQVVGRYVDMLFSLGKSTGKEITMGKDLIGIKRREDSSDVVTALKCYGPESEDGTQQIVIVTDEEARQRWSRTGEHLWDRYEPESDDVDMTVERLTSLGKTELAKRVNSVVEYEVNHVAIDFGEGSEHERAFLHDRIRIKDEGFNPPLYLEADVIEVKRNPFDPSSKVFTLGQFVEYAEDDLLSQFRRFNNRVGVKLIIDDVKPAGRPKTIWINTNSPLNTPHTYNSAIEDWVKFAPTEASEIGGLEVGQQYNGVTITPENGLLVNREDGLVETIVNATGGFTIRTRATVLDSWKDAAYIGTGGTLTLAGLIKGSDIILGGTDNQNGSLTLLNENGESVFDLNAADIGSSRMVIGEVISPSVLSVQQLPMTLYVNTSTGNDINVGSLALPFKTIQAAVNSIPKYLRSNVTIEVATGTFNEIIIVAGFTGEGDLRINLNKCGINGRIMLINCSNIIDVRGQDFNNHAKIGTVDGADPIAVITCQYAVLQNLWAKANDRADYGLYVAASNVYTYHCVHERALEAGMFTTIGGNLYAFSGRGSGNKYAAKASSGSRIHMESTRPTFSTAATSQTTGGQVTESVGITSVPSPGDSSGSTPTEPVTVSQGKILETSVSCLTWDDRYGWDAGNTLTQGEYSGFGNHRGLMYFDASSIQTALAGKTIKSVRLYMTRKNSGGDSASSMLSFYLHNYASQPVGMPALGTSLGGLGSFVRNESKWITLPNSVGDALKAGTAKGLAIYAPSGKPYVLMNPAVQLEINYEG